MISMSMIRYLAFQMSEVFPEDDPLSEWLITLALAMNDLALVHVRLDEDQEEPDRAFYWNRLAVSHFTEAALFLRDTADVPEVRAFVESLGDKARTKYDECLAIFHEYRGELFSKRNKATFHDRALRPVATDVGRRFVGPPVRGQPIAVLELGDGGPERQRRWKHRPGRSTVALRWKHRR